MKTWFIRTIIYYLSKTRKGRWQSDSLNDKKYEALLDVWSHSIYTCKKALDLKRSGEFPKLNRFQDGRSLNMAAVSLDCTWSIFWALALLGNDIMDQLLIIIHIVLQLQQHTVNYDDAQSHLVHFSTLGSVVSASTVLLNNYGSRTWPVLKLRPWSSRTSLSTVIRKWLLLVPA